MSMMVDGVGRGIGVDVVGLDLAKTTTVKNAHNIVIGSMWNVWS